MVHVPLVRPRVAAGILSPGRYVPGGAALENPEHDGQHAAPAEQVVPSAQGGLVRVFDVFFCVGIRSTRVGHLLCHCIVVGRCCFQGSTRYTFRPSREKDLTSHVTFRPKRDV